MLTKDVVYIALLASFIAVLAIFPPITIPGINVPITAQTLGVMLAGGILGAKRGSLAVLLLLVLVAIGLPLLAGGRGGMSVYAGATAGFLFGWIVAAFVVGWLVERYWQRLNFLKAFSACVLGGIVVLYSFGVPWLAVVANLPLSKALIGSMAFVPGDIIKAVLAAAIILLVKKSYPIIGR